MNRQAKRAMQRRQQAGAAAGGAGGGSRRDAAVRRQLMEQKKGRTGFRQFLKEVRGELKKVNWPSRREMLTYTFVVLVTVVIMATYVFGLDFVVSEGIFRVFGLN